MNCDQYLAKLATAPMTELDEPYSRQHAEACPHCARVTQVVAERESMLATAYQSVYSQTPAVITANAARVVSHRRTSDWTNWVAWGVAAVGAIWFVGARLFPHEETMYRDAMAPSSMVEEAFLTGCLQVAQAADLIRPALRSEGTAVVTPSGVLMMQGSREAVERARIALERQQLRAGCMMPLPTPTAALELPPLPTPATMPTPGPTPPLPPLPPRH